MPISYPIPLEPLWKDALLSHVKHFVVLQLKIFIFVPKQTDWDKVSKLLGFPRKMICKAIPVYLPAVCNTGFWLTEGMKHFIDADSL